MSKQVPEVVVLRLPIYLRALLLLEKEGQEIVNSEELAKRLGLNAAQIRKDLSLFGKFGKQGKGYYVEVLKEKLTSLLKADRSWKVALIGVGRLGQALLGLRHLQQNNFKIVAAFDKDSQIIGKIIEGVEVKPVEQLKEVAEKEKIKIAIVAVPAMEAQKVIDQLISCQIKAILNYAPITPTIPPDVRERNIDPVAALQSMTYYL